MGFVVDWPESNADHLIVSAKQMAELENKILSSGLPVEALMEKVGGKMSRWFLKRGEILSEGVILLIGPGHNGGDGLVVARELHLSGVNVSIWCPLSLKKTLTIKQFEYADWLGIKQLNQAPNVSGEELWIEALFGLGQTRPLPHDIADLLNEREVNKPGRLISLDVPAGICSDKGKPLGQIAAKASCTLTVGFYKRGLVQDCALPFVGHLFRIDFGFPEKVLKQLIPNAPFRICAEDISTFHWPLLSPIATKYERGRLLIIAGSDKYPGAALLAIKGALASGAGSIQVALPKSISDCLWQDAPEVVLRGVLETTSDGGASLDRFLQEHSLDRFDSLVIGPGLGMSDEKWSQVTVALQAFSGLIIFDADALNRISISEEGWEWLRKRKGQTVITPHLNEFKRLFKQIDFSNPIEAASEAARLTGAGVLLKGAHSVFAAPSGLTWQIGESAPWIARTGLGDVLAGFLGGVGSIEIASKKKIDWALIAVVSLIHAEAGKNCEFGSTASSIASKLSAFVRDLNQVQCLERDT